MYSWLEVRVVMEIPELSLAAIASSIAGFRSFPCGFPHWGLICSQTHPAQWLPFHDLA